MSIKEKIALTFPQLGNINTATLLGEGFGSIVIEVDARWIFRIAKNKIVQQNHIREFDLLNKLVPCMNSSIIPHPSFYVEHNAYFDYGVMCYQKISGIPFQPIYLTHANMSSIVKQIAKFLYELHSTKINILPAYSAFPTNNSNYLNLFTEVSSYLKHELSFDKFAILLDWHRKVQEFLLLLMFKPVLIHGDFWYENILVNDDKSKVTAVLDFENCTYNYALLDFMVLDYISEKFRNEVIAEYTILGGNTNFTKNLDTQISILMGIRELNSLLYGLKIDNVDPDSIKKIEETILS